MRALSVGDSVCAGPGPGVRTADLLLLWEVVDTPIGETRRALRASGFT